MCDSCSAEYAELSLAQWRTASRPRHCDECGRSIATGDLYEHTFGIFEGDAFTVDVCTKCRALYSAHHAAMRKIQEDCMPSVGELRSSIRECIAENSAYRAALAEAWRHELRFRRSAA